MVYGGFTDGWRVVRIPDEGKNIVAVFRFVIFQGIMVEGGKRGVEVVEADSLYTGASACTVGLTKALIRTAKANDIDYSLEIMEGDTGTNAWTMQIVGRGIACALLSIPQKYMHTPVEVISLSDVEAVADLMAAFLREFDGEVKA